MNSTELLLSRQSNPHLTAPEPNAAELDFILSAGMRVPDHGGLKPWHFTIASGNALSTLADIFVDAATKDGLERGQIDQQKLSKAANMPFRAPMIIIVSTVFSEHPKVPKQEQLIAAALTVHAMQLAAFSLGLGAMWRTGEFCYHLEVKKALGVIDDNEIVGFLYVGSEAKALPRKPSHAYSSKVSYL